MSDGSTHMSSSPAESDSTSGHNSTQEMASPSYRPETDLPINQGAESFDLSDPSNLEMRIDQLSDAEIDELLKEAYHINRELKDELLRRERDYESGSLHDDIDKVQLPPLRNTSASSSSSNRPTTKRGFTSLGHKPASYNLYNTPVKSNRQKAKTALQQPSKPRPEWNDRFGY